MGSKPRDPRTGLPLPPRWILDSSGKIAKDFTRNKHGHVWHGRDPFLMNFRLKDLRRFGYVNWIDTTKRIPDLGDPITTAKPVLGDSGHSPVHPVFQKSNWRHLKRGDYKLLLPSLRLASCWLTEYSTLPFFKGLCGGLVELENVEEAKKRLKVKHLYRVEPVPNDPPEHTTSKIMAKVLLEMKYYVKFSFKPSISYYADGTPLASAWTDPQGHKSGFHKRTTASSKIRIEETLIKTLRGDIKLAGFPKAAPHDKDSAKARTHFMLAILLIHEFCHALHFAWYEVLPSFVHPGDNNGMPLFEPFYLNDYIAEWGWAWENAVLGGIPGPSGRPQHMAAVYGLLMESLVGMSAKGPVEMLYSHAKMGISNRAFAGVKVKDYMRYFESEYWDKEVGMLGASALKLPWEIGLWYGLRDRGFCDEETETVLPGAGEQNLLPPRPSIGALRRDGWKVKTNEDSVVWETSSSEEGEATPGVAGGGWASWRSWV